MQKILSFSILIVLSAQMSPAMYDYEKFAGTPFSSSSLITSTEEELKEPAGEQLNSKSHKSPADFKKRLSILYLKMLWVIIKQRMAQL